MTLWPVDHQAPLSMEFSRQEDYSGLPFSTPGDLPNPGIKPTSPDTGMTQRDGTEREVGGGFRMGKMCARYAVLSHSFVSNSLRPHGL